MTNEELVKAIQNGTNEKRNVELLLKQNQGMIYKGCLRYVHNDNGITMDDLFQESALSIYEAIKNYDESKGAFITYFVYWQRLYLNRYVYGQDLIDIKSFKQYVRKYHSFCDEFFKEFGTTPTDAEAATYLEVKQSKIRRIKEACFMSQVRSLDYQYTSDSEDSYSIEQGAEDSNIEAVERRADNEHLRACLDRCINNLPEEQALAIRQKYLSGEKRFNDRRLKSLVQMGLYNIRRNHKDMEQLRSYRDWIDSKSYRVGYGNWKSGHGVDWIAIQRLYADLRLSQLEVM